MAPGATTLNRPSCFTRSLESAFAHFRLATPLLPRPSASTKFHADGGNPALPNHRAERSQRSHDTLVLYFFSIVSVSSRYLTHFFEQLDYEPLREFCQVRHSAAHKQRNAINT